MAHTPGPWKLSDGEDEYVYDGDPFMTYSIFDKDQKQIAIVPTDQAEEYLDNGRLLATAPEMQTLLRKIRWVLEQKHWRTYGALATLRNDIDDLLGD